ncbi:hypothetical protein JKP88DRAFT_244027 [Tribonema minus]|uniref:Uncharacterized protein n=1 Tax=Tribonema minus TaxID=303371 RepID=A0A835Z5I6_9STRA|nr:hypothetical protein JKP88DRAFT_244027 [Tribonema minus]
MRGKARILRPVRAARTERKHQRKQQQPQQRCRATTARGTVTGEHHSLEGQSPENKRDSLACTPFEGRQSPGKHRVACLAKTLICRQHLPAGAGIAAGPTMKLKYTSGDSEFQSGSRAASLHPGAAAHWSQVKEAVRYVCVDICKLIVNAYPSACLQVDVNRHQLNQPMLNFEEEQVDSRHYHSGQQLLFAIDHHANHGLQLLLHNQREHATA